MKTAIGIDVGGNKISFVAFRQNKVITSNTITTPQTKELIIWALESGVKRIIQELKLPKSQIKGVGIGLPGPINNKGDLILNPPNLAMPVLSNLALAKIIEKDLSIKTKMDNDGNCFTLAEAKLGAGKNAEMVVGITLGTGIGGGIVYQGQLWRGAHGSAAEVGHTIIEREGYNCSCSSQGCWEEYASQKLFKRLRIDDPRKIKDEKKRKKVLVEFSRNLAIGLANIVNFLDPDIIVIGGGLSGLGDLILKPAQQEMRRRIISPEAKKEVKVVKAKLGEFAGAIGAALLIE